MNNANKIYVPRETVNDETVVVVGINVSSGQEVLENQVLFLLETSKTIIEVSSPSNGVLQHSLKLGEVVKVGGEIGVILLETEDNNLKSITSTLLEAENISSIAVLGGTPPQPSASSRSGDVGWVSSRQKEVCKIGRISESLNNNQPVTSKNNKLAANKIVIVGGGVHAAVCIDMILIEKNYEIVGIVDKHKAKGEVINGVEVIGDDADLEDLLSRGVKYAVNAVGSATNMSARAAIFSSLVRLGFRMPNLIHPSSVIEPSVLMGCGNQVMMGACVGSEVRIGDNCILNSGSIISHHSIIGSHTHVAPGAILAGSVQIGESVVIGMGCTIYSDVKIGDNSSLVNGVNIFANVESNQIIKK